MAHSIYGVASTINAANYVFFLALEKVQQLGHPDVSVAYLVLKYIYNFNHFDIRFVDLGHQNLHRTIIGIASWPRDGNLLA